MKRIFVFLLILVPMFSHASQPTCEMLFMQDIEQARFVKEQMKLLIRSTPGLEISVVGGVGLTTVEGRYALKVGLFNKKAADQIPSIFMGLAVVTDVVGVIKMAEVAETAATAKISTSLMVRFAMAPTETVYPIVVRLRESLSTEQAEVAILKLEAAGVHVFVRLGSTMVTARATEAAIKSVASFEEVESIQGRVRLTGAP